MSISTCFQVDIFLLKEEKLWLPGGFHRSTESSVMHVTRTDLHVGQMFSRHLYPLYPPTGTLSEKASACLSTQNPAVPFKTKVTATVPNCLEGSCDAGHAAVSVGVITSTPGWSSNEMQWRDVRKVQQSTENQMVFLQFSRYFCLQLLCLL